MLVACLACGEPEESAPDALGPWQSPVFVTTLRGDDPTLSADLRELYYDDVSDDIFVMARESTAAAWSSPAPVAALLDTASVESTPELSADGLSLLFSSTRDGGQGLDVWITTRATRTSGWEGPVALAELASPDDDFSASLSADALVVVLARPSGNRDLFIATRTSIADPWSTPMPIVELNTPGG